MPSNLKEDSGPLEDERNEEKTASKSEEAAEDDEPMYDVEAVRKMRGTYPNRKFFIKWDGYSEDENTWEPERNLMHIECVRLFAEEAERKRDAKQLKHERNKLQNFSTKRPAAAIAEKKAIKEKIQEAKPKESEEPKNPVQLKLKIPANYKPTNVSVNRKELTTSSIPGRSKPASSSISEKDKPKVPTKLVKPVQPSKHNWLFSEHLPLKSAKVVTTQAKPALKIQPLDLSQSLQTMQEKFRKSVAVKPVANKSAAEDQRKKNACEKRKQDEEELFRRKEIEEKAARKLAKKEEKERLFKESSLRVLEVTSEKLAKIAEQGDNEKMAVKSGPKGAENVMDGKNEDGFRTKETEAVTIYLKNHDGEDDDRLWIAELEDQVVHTASRMECAELSEKCLTSGEQDNGETALDECESDVAGGLESSGAGETEIEKPVPSLNEAVDLSLVNNMYNDSHSLKIPSTSNVNEIASAKNVGNIPMDSYEKVRDDSPEIEYRPPARIPVPKCRDLEEGELPSTTSNSDGECESVGPRSRSVSITISDKSDEGEFVPRRIVADRYSPSWEQQVYRVEWEGYGSEDDTWEPESNIQHLFVYQDYVEKKRTERRKPKSSPRSARRSSSTETSPESRLPKEIRKEVKKEEIRSKPVDAKKLEKSSKCDVSRKEKCGLFPPETALKKKKDKAKDLSKTPKPFAKTSGAITAPVRSSPMISYSVNKNCNAFDMTSAIKTVEGSSGCKPVELQKTEQSPVVEFFASDPLTTPAPLGVPTPVVAPTKPLTPFSMVRKPEAPPVNKSLFPFDRKGCEPVTPFRSKEKPKSKKSSSVQVVKPEDLWLTNPERIMEQHRIHGRLNIFEMYMNVPQPVPRVNPSELRQIQTTALPDDIEITTHSISRFDPALERMQYLGFQRGPRVNLGGKCPERLDEDAEEALNNSKSRSSRSRTQGIITDFCEYFRERLFVRQRNLTALEGPEHIIDELVRPLHYNVFQHPDIKPADNPGNNSWKRAVKRVQIPKRTQLSQGRNAFY